MEENKVATDKELRARATKLALLPVLQVGNFGDRLKERSDLADAIFRELVAVRDQTLEQSLANQLDELRKGSR